MSTKVLRMVDLMKAVAGPFEDSTGVVHDVLQITFGQYQAFRAPPAEGGQRDELDHVRNIVQELIPTLPDSELAKLNLDAAQAITALSAGGIDVVEAAFPNAVGPATSMSPA